MSSVGSEREEMQEMQELLVYRHGSEDLVSQQQARRWPRVTACAYSDGGKLSGSLS